MKRFTILTFTALMGLAVFAPLAASADGFHKGYEAQPVRKEVRREVRFEDRRNDHDRDFREKRDRGHEVQVRFEWNKRDCR